MEKSLPYFLGLICLSFIIFLIISSSFGSTFPTTDILLSLILSHLIIDKNPTIISYFKKKHVKKEELSKNDQKNSI